LPLPKDIEITPSKKDEILMAVMSHAGPETTDIDICFTDISNRPLI